jgi:hypothetical protein
VPKSRQELKAELKEARSRFQMLKMISGSEYTKWRIEYLSRRVSELELRIANPAVDEWMTSEEIQAELSAVREELRENQELFSGIGDKVSEAERVYHRAATAYRRKLKLSRSKAAKVVFDDSSDDEPSPSYGSSLQGMKKRITEPVTARDKKNTAPPTAEYWYGTGGRRWAGRGRKAPLRNWKRYRPTQYASH